MAEEIKNENIVSEAPEGAVAEAMHDAPKKGAGKADPMQKAGDYEDLGPAVTSPTDKVGQVVALTTNSIRFFVGSDYEREKLIEVKQDLPYPMTVLSIATNIDVEGS